MDNPYEHPANATLEVTRLCMSIGCPQGALQGARSDLSIPCVVSLQGPVCPLVLDFHNNAKSDGKRFFPMQ